MATPAEKFFRYSPCLRPRGENVRRLPNKTKQQARTGPKSRGGGASAKSALAGVLSTARRMDRGPSVLREANRTPACTAGLMAGSSCCRSTSELLAIQKRNAESIAKSTPLRQSVFCNICIFSQLRGGRFLRRWQSNLSKTCKHLMQTRTACPKSESKDQHAR